MLFFSRRLCGVLLLGLLLPACGVGGGGTLTPTIQPAAPSGVTASAGNRSVTVEWKGSSAGVTYSVKRSLTSGGPFFDVSVPGQFRTATSYVDAGVANGTTYYYVVSASNRFGESADSSEASVIPGFTPRSIIGGSVADYSMVILQDGTLWAWGINDKLQLGSGSSFPEQGTPVQTAGLHGVVAASAGFNHALALLNDGTVRSWGDNTYNQLGLGVGGPPQAGTAQEVPALDGVVAISAGGGHSLALRSDGTVWGWGGNVPATLGNGTNGGTVPSPLPIANLSKIIAVAAGNSHSLALRADGTVWMWGSNESGMKGDGTYGSNEIVTFATQVPNLTGVTSIAVGLHFCLALRSDGTVYAWGNNQYGQMGNGTTGTPLPWPTKITLLTDIVTISAGRSHAFALKRDGTVWAWGQNQIGQIGNGTSSATPVSTPVPLPTLTDIVHVQGGNGHSLALRSDGALLAWGTNGSGEIGNGTSRRIPVPVPVFNLTDVTALGTSWFHTLALRGDGTVYAWGENSDGALGNGSASATVYPLPAAVTGLTGATAVAAGMAHSLAVVGGTVRGWGSNASGQLGTGGTSATPVTGPVQALVLTGITAVAAGGSHSLALKDDKTVWAWGSNSGGQLGTGGGSTATPALVPGLTNVTAIAAGNNLSMALRDDGTVWAWGVNTSGEIGIGAATPNTVVTPTQVLNLTNITAISGGWEFALALRDDGTVWGWGANAQGQAGVAPAGTVAFAPVQIPGFTGVTAIDAGGAHSLALKSDGTVWSWGYNNNGQLGNGVDVNNVVPLQVSTPPGVIGISSGAVHSLAILSNKTLMAWGFNGQSQLARPFVTIVTTPVAINP